MKNKKVDYTKCMAVTGFNTKQVWVYDNEHDTYIDPPKCVVDEVEEKAGYWNFNGQESLLEEIIATDPDWLQDKEYTYDAEENDI
jgi:hypothetical protein